MQNAAGMVLIPADPFRLGHDKAGANPYRQACERGVKRIAATTHHVMSPPIPTRVRSSSRTSPASPLRKPPRTMSRTAATSEMGVHGAGQHVVFENHNKAAGIRFVLQPQKEMRATGRYGRHALRSTLRQEIRQVRKDSACAPFGDNSHFSLMSMLTFIRGS